MKRILSNLIVLSCSMLLFAGCDSKEAAPQTPAENSAEESAENAAPEGEEAAEEEVEAGQWVEVPTYELKLRVPEDWEIKSDEQGASASSPDGTTTLLLAGSESEGLTTAILNQLRPDLKFKELEVQKIAPAIINGMAVSNGEGIAVLVKEDMDQEIQFLGYSIKRSGGKIATLFIFAEAEMYEAKKDEIRGIAQTLVETSN